MAKVPISARVPAPMAREVDEYAEVLETSRTGAVTWLLEKGLTAAPAPWQVEGEHPEVRTYTLELGPENAEVIEQADVPPDEAVNNLLEHYRKRFPEQLDG